MQIVELIKAATFESGNHNLRDPTSKEDKGYAHWNEPTGEYQELDLFFHLIDV
jgi:hypothetical protein